MGKKRRLTQTTPVCGNTVCASGIISAFYDEDKVERNIIEDGSRQNDGQTETVVRIWQCHRCSSALCSGDS